MRVSRNCKGESLELTAESSVSVHHFFRLLIHRHSKRLKRSRVPRHWNLLHPGRRGCETVPAAFLWNKIHKKHLAVHVKSQFVFLDSSTQLLKPALANFVAAASSPAVARAPCPRRFPSLIRCKGGASHAPIEVPVPKASSSFLVFDIHVFGVNHAFVFLLRLAIAARCRTAFRSRPRAWRPLRLRGLVHLLGQLVRSLG